MIWGPMAVKHSNQGSEFPVNSKPVAPVWLVGWPLTIPSAGLAMVAALLAVPHATEPHMVPQPVIHVRELNVEFDALERQASVARSHPLPYAIREVGEAYRRLGRIQFEGPQLLDDGRGFSWQALVRSARTRSGDAALLSLRAVEVQLFVNSLEAWEKSGKVPDDLAELGGDFVNLAQRNHWWESGRLAMSHEERWAIGLLRWTTLAGLLMTEPFRLSRNLELLELRFFFANAKRMGSAPELQQRILNRYSELEPDYPIEYARGVIAAQQSQFELAAAGFTRQLQAHPDGNYVTRARNHLIWVTAQMQTLETGIEAR